MGDRVTVTVPCYRVGPYLARAVESLLAQTHRDVVVVVVNDGDPAPPWPLLDHLDDPRLVRFDLDTNRGRYCADQVVLAATGDPWYALQDADDWSEPARLERLLRAVRRPGVHGAVSACHLESPHSSRVRAWPLLGTPLPPTMQHRAMQLGLFRTTALRQAGGFHPGFRVGYDTLLVNLLEMLGRVVAVPAPLYHVTIRPGSLTTAPETRWGSPLRTAAARRLQALYTVAHRAHRRHLAGRCTTRQLATLIHDLTRGSWAPADADFVQDHAERLRHLLPAPRRTRPIPVAPPRPHRAAAVPAPPPVVTEPLRVYQLIGEPSFSGSPIVAIELAEHLDRTRPRTLLHVGGGPIATVLAAHVARRGGTLTVLDDDPGRRRNTAETLAGLALGDAVTLGDPIDGTPERLDVVHLADPAPLGHRAALAALAPRLADGAEVWLPEDRRTGGPDHPAPWRDLPFRADIHHLDDRGTVVLRRAGGTWPAAPAPRPAPVEVPPGLAVTLLAGGPPRQLRRTVESLAQAVPELLARARVTVLLNGDDPESGKLVRELPFVDRILRHRGPPLTAGAATSRLIAAALGQGAHRFVLHLTDDWAVCTLDRTWPSRAATILTGDPRVGQVRLRHRGEPVLSHHMITGAPIRWEPRHGHLLSASAHWTFQPSLFRASDAALIWPAPDEANAQRHFHRSGRWTAQLSPGVFRRLSGSRVPAAG